jgi:hypothetical protein
LTLNGPQTMVPLWCLVCYDFIFILNHGPLLPLLFICSLEYAITRVHEYQVGLKLSGKYQLLIYADDVNLLGDDINTIK